MSLSWSQIARPADGIPHTISIAGSATSSTAPTTRNESSSNPTSEDLPQAPTTSSSVKQDETTSSASQDGKPSITHLILDAGPLLSLTPLRHLAQTFHTTPMVLAELRDPRAREHWERLKLAVDVKVEAPRADCMAKVMAFAKKTGDYAVLSQTDMSVIALTYQYEAMVNGEKHIRTEPGQKTKPAESTSALAEALTAEGSNTATETSEDSKELPVQGEEAREDVEISDEESEDEEEESQKHDASVENSASGKGDIEETTRSIESVLLDDPSTSETQPTSSHSANVASGPKSSTSESPSTVPITAADEEDESSGDEWITPSNLIQHRSKDLGLITSGGKNQPPAHLAAACMTGDFAVQNVLLGMGLGLVGEGGKKISKVKSFVLRCHACFKLCKDSSKKFCPSCGNPTLLRTTVTTSANGDTKIHLKKNFQYHLRGTKYTIPDAKPGRAKGQSKGGTGLILREDQAEWMEASRMKGIAERKEEKRLVKGGLEGWNDPDWLPEILTVGMSGKGRRADMNMPNIGHGRRNPNAARRKK